MYFLARQHPGETTGSFCIEGIVDFLCGESEESKMLREKFVFKIFPMVNVDGVVHGNNRGSVLGVDLNRSWKDCEKERTPEIFCIKNLILKNLKERETRLLVDFHSHSKK